MTEKRIEVEFDDAGVYTLAPSQFQTNTVPSWVSRSIGFYTLRTLFLAALMSVTREQRLLRGLKYQTRLCPGPPVVKGGGCNWWQHVEELKNEICRSMRMDFARAGEDRAEHANRESARYFRYPPVVNDLKWPRLDVHGMRFYSPLNLNLSDSDFMEAKFCPLELLFSLPEVEAQFGTPPDQQTFESEYMGEWPKLKRAYKPEEHLDGETFLSITPDPSTIAQESPSVDANAPKPTSDLETFEPYGRSEFEGILSGVLEHLYSSRRAFPNPEQAQPVVMHHTPSMRVCYVCLEKADFQIGAYIPSVSHPHYYCSEHLPKWAKREVDAGNYTDEREER